MQLESALRAVKGIDFELQFRLVPIDILIRLKDSMKKHRFSGAAGQFIEEYYMNYNFEVPQDYRSILVVSYPQPHAQIAIETETEGGSGLKYVTIPSGYYNPSFAEHMHRRILDAIELKGIRAKRVHLPLKLLGALSGLTQYGKNNISYVKPYGSQHRLVAFFTDAKVDAVTNTVANTKMVAFEGDEAIQMDYCNHCNACVQGCPYGAIEENGDLIDPNKCLSFYMDLMDPLPIWTSRAQVSAIIGCTHCQDCCSLNRYFSVDRRETIAVISKTQMEEIEVVDHYEDLSNATKALVDTLDFKNSYALFKRNIGVL